MGKNARIAELEREIEILRSRNKLSEEVIDYILDLTKMPEDAVLFYRIGSQEVFHEIGLSARVLLEKIAKGRLVKIE